MTNCKKKDNICYCRPDYCFIANDPAFDCWTIRADNCDADSDADVQVVSERRAHERLQEEKRKVHVQSWRVSFDA
jgi:hypothetical protein